MSDGAARAPSRSLRIGARRYPVDLPSWRDARLHASMVVLTLHVLGQLAFGFRVSVVQILAAIAASAVLELAITFVRQRRIVWPASAILTGSGVGLILRISEPDVVERIGHWSSTRWYVFAGVSVGSLGSKYLLRVGGRQVFNPSNLGLLVAFLVLGSDRVEPLDLWWAPFGPAMALAYVVVIGGGAFITGRLRLWPMAVGFWVTLAAGGAVLAASGHCITTNWSARPVCDGSFWWLLISSPEIAVFLFFMITDPKTAPGLAAHRALFGAAVALVGLYLMAPYRSEFATKVALFAALAMVCGARALGTAAVAAARKRTSERGASADVAAAQPQPQPQLLPMSMPMSMLLPMPLPLSMLLGAAAPVAVGLLAVGLVLAGAPARHAFPPVGPANVINRAATLAALDLSPAVDLLPLPTISFDPSVHGFDASLVQDGGAAVARSLQLNLAVEAEAQQRNDAELLVVVDHGARLAELRRTIDTAERTGRRTVPEHRISTMRLHVVRLGGQAGSLLAVDTEGSVLRNELDPDGTVISTSREQASWRFVLRPAGDEGQWLIVEATAR
ncbi:MAG: hypothetical protein ACKV2O_22445 [Acidimicrobiales bacterium]